MKHKNKLVIKDSHGQKWWVTLKNKIYPTHWKKQCYMYVEQVNRKLYGDKS